MHVKFRSEKNDTVLTGDEVVRVWWLHLVSPAQISKASKVVYSRVSLAKEPAMPILLKLWPPSNVVADIRDVVRTKSTWHMISSVMLYTGLRYM